MTKGIIPTVSGWGQRLLGLYNPSRHPVSASPMALSRLQPNMMPAAQPLFAAKYGTVSRRPDFVARITARFRSSPALSREERVPSDRVIYLDKLKPENLPHDMLNEIIPDYIKHLLENGRLDSYSVFPPEGYFKQWRKAHGYYRLGEVKKEAVIVEDRVIYGNRIYMKKAWKRRCEIIEGGETPNEVNQEHARNIDFNSPPDLKEIPFQEAIIDKQLAGIETFYVETADGERFYIDPSHVMFTDSKTSEIDRRIEMDFAGEVAARHLSPFGIDGSSPVVKLGFDWEGFVNNWFQTNGIAWARQYGYRFDHEVHPIPVTKGGKVIIGDRVYQKDEWKKKMSLEGLLQPYRDINTESDKQVLPGDIKHRSATEKELALAAYKLPPQKGRIDASIIKSRQLYYRAITNIGPRISAELWNSFVDAIEKMNGENRIEQKAGQRKFEEIFKKILNLNDETLQKFAQILDIHQRRLICLVAGDVNSPLSLHDPRPAFRSILHYIKDFIFDNKALATSEIQALNSIPDGERDAAIESLLKLHAKMASLIHPWIDVKINPARAYTFPSEAIYHGDWIGSTYLTPEWAGRALKSLHMRFKYDEGGINFELSRLAIQLALELQDEDEQFMKFVEGMKKAWDKAVEGLTRQNGISKEALKRVSKPRNASLTEFASRMVEKEKDVCRHKAMAITAAFQRAGFDARILEGSSGREGINPHALVAIKTGTEKLFVFDQEQNFYGWVTERKRTGDGMIVLKIEDPETGEIRYFRYFSEMPNFTTRTIR